MMVPLTPALLLRAYAAGIFPMAESADDLDVFWVDPQLRGILPLDQVHVPRRLRRTVRRHPFEIRCDTAFRKVIEACAEPAGTRPSTWINDGIMDVCVELFERGYAHSVECWEGEELVGGLYGIALQGAFFGESMFNRRTDASKVALIHLVARLHYGGFVLLDTQFITDHLKQFGTIEIPRREYRRRLAAALSVNAVFHGDLGGTDALSLVLQSTSQTS